MAKTVTIPLTQNPLKVWCNGMAYEFAAGTTVSVPDEVAEIIRQMSTAEPSLPPPSTGGGDITPSTPDWNQNDSTAPDYIKNRPFYESTSLSDTLTWDGNTDGLVSVGGGYVTGYKICDGDIRYDDIVNNVPSINFVIGTAESDEINGTYLPDAYSDVLGELSEGITLLMFAGGIQVVFATADGAGLESEGFPESGVYILSASALTITNFVLTLEGYEGFAVTETTKIPEKFLPISTARLYFQRGDKYLYRVPGSTEAADRLTVAELQKMVDEGTWIMIFPASETGAGYRIPVAVSIEANGEIGLVGVSNTQTVDIYYTAEYEGS